MLGFHMQCANIRSPAGHSSCAIVNLHWHQSLPAGVDGTHTPPNGFEQRIGGIISHKCFVANKDNRQHHGMMIYEALLPIFSGIDDWLACATFSHQRRVLQGHKEFTGRKFA